MATIKDVARAAGVSIATVSYVLNNKTSAVSEETRIRVLDAVQQLGYTRNITARNLRSNQSKLIGYAWPEIAQGPDIHPDSFLEHFAFHLAREAWACGYHLLTFTYPKTDPIPVHDEMIRTGRVDAFIIANTDSDDVRIRYLLDRKFPFVAFGRSSPEWDFNWVDTDNRLGVYRAVEHLIALGHRRIGMVAWPKDSLTGNLRLAGYHDALRDAGITPHPDYVVHTVYGESVGVLVFDQIAHLPPEEQPTAYVTVSDMTAISLMREAERRGHIIGKTLSVIGYDDEVMSRFLHPPLTSVRQPIREISYELIAMVEEILNGNPPETRQLLMPPELVVRETTGNLPHP
jgi:DNA-binding LacI/PurR family transcriptional regulator